MSAPRGIGIIGAGAFGTALGVVWARAGAPVTLWGRQIRWQDQNPRLPGVAIPEGLRLTSDLAALDQTVIVLALPAQSLRGFLAEHGAALDGRILVNTAKGIDLSTGEGPARLIAEACPRASVAVLTGPSFAADIAQGLPTALTLACRDAACARDLQAQLSAPALRLYRSADVVGAELGGALKNVIAIAAGICIGAGLGESARAALMTRGFAEMHRLALHLGAEAATLSGLSGLGDLVLTCGSTQSRNFRLGHALGAGRPPEPGITVEGAATARAAAAIATREGIEMPVTQAVAGLASGRLSVQNVIEGLMARPLTEE